MRAVWGPRSIKKGSSVRNYCHLSDLSPGGCYLEMPLAFEAGVTVEIVVRTYEIKLRLIGQVKTSHPSYGMGVLFHLNTKDERHGVQTLIDFVAATAAEQRVVAGTRFPAASSSCRRLISCCEFLPRIISPTLRGSGWTGVGAH